MHNSLQNLDWIDEQGYRFETMRAPTPEGVEGATTLSPEQLVELLEQPESPVLIDVLPLLWRGIFVMTEPHLNIKGSTWLPNVGRAELEPEWQAYLEQSLLRLTGDRPSTPLVIYCRADCWYSWNAAKRIARMGYTSVYWYPLGVDGWRDLGRDLVDARPVPLKDTERQDNNN